MNPYVGLLRGLNKASGQRISRKSPISLAVPSVRVGACRCQGEGKTVAKSFRVNEKALEALQEEAKRQSISVNTLVNQLLLNYSEFGRYLQRVNALKMSRKTFEEILNSVSDDSLVKAAQTAGKSAQSLLLPLSTERSRSAQFSRTFTTSPPKQTSSNTMRRMKMSG